MPGTHDRRRQVVRALEGNVIIQDFHDRIGQERLHARDQNQENSGYVGFSRINDPNAVDTLLPGWKIGYENLVIFGLGDELLFLNDVFLKMYGLLIEMLPIDTRDFIV